MKICIITLGCKVNSYESDSLAGDFARAGFLVTTKLELADVYLINSCAVTNIAEHKSREVVTKINKINPNAKIYVCGCSSQLHPDSFLTKQNVIAVMGTENKNEIINIIKNGLTGDQRAPINNVAYNTHYSANILKTRTYIKVQDGCNNFCSYCIIPYTRGRERSRTIEDIKKELDAVYENTGEVVIVGINMAAYGKDLSPRRTVSDIVRLFGSYQGLRLRFSSFEMGTITEDFLLEVQKLAGFCPFFHISMQSASNNVLAKMNRKYKIEEYIETVNLVRRYFPKANISTDIIVGFPTETQQDHMETIENVKKIKFGNVHIFPYSSREGTVAGKLKKINGVTVKERIAELKQVTDASRVEYLNGLINDQDEVLVEEKYGGYYTGYTKTYIKCYIKSNCDLINKIVKVKLTKTILDGLEGEIIYE